MLLHPASGVAKISCEEGHETKRVDCPSLLGQFMQLSNVTISSSIISYSANKVFLLLKRFDRHSELSNKADYS